MKVKFNQALLIGGPFYKHGQELDADEAFMDHPHVGKYLQCGWIVDGSGESLALETLEERNKRLAEKLGAKGEAKKAKPKK